MKRGNWISVLLLTVGIALGFALGRVTVGHGGGGNGTVGEADGASGKSGNRMESGTTGRRADGKRGGKSGRSPVAAIRQVSRKLELSPMVGMDFDALFDAYEAIRWMGPEEVRMALDELDDATGNPQIRQVLQMMLISRWAKQDGRGAVEYAMGLRAPMQKMIAMMGGLQGWARTDPDAAYAWYQENRGEMKGAMMGKGMMDGIFFSSMAQHDMKKAFTRLKELNKSEQETAIMMMSQGSTMDPGRRREFLAELDQIENESVRKSGMQGLLSQWVMQDPEGAVKFVESREWEDGLGEEMRQSLAASWANLDPEAALDYRLETAGDQENRGDAVASQFSRWMGQDPNAAAEWLGKQPEELRTDQLYGDTAEQLRRNDDYDLAVQWAEQIGDEGARGEKLGRIYNEWKMSDETEAQEWLEGLDASVREDVEKGAAPIHPEILEVVPEPSRGR